MTTPGGLQAAIIVPAAPGLLPCRGQEDPFAEVRTAAVAALRATLEAVGPDVSVGVLGSENVAGALLREAGFTGSFLSDAAVLVVAADGTARRSEKAPGHLDERAFGFDQQIEDALRSGDGVALTRLDPDLACELWCSGVPAFHELGRQMPSARGELLMAADPFGVRYWVARWTAMDSPFSRTYASFIE